MLGFLFATDALGDVADALGVFPQFAFAWVRHGGPVAAGLGLYAEESGVPLFVPGDIFLVYIGRHLGGPVWWLVAWLSLIAAVVLGASNLYLISRRWGEQVIHGRLGRIVHLTPERMSKAQHWFDRYGVWVLIFGRHIPGFRIPITVAAGTLQVKYPVFASCVAISSAIWVGFFLFLGVRFGAQVEAILRSHHILFLVALAVVLALVLAGGRVRHLARRPAAAVSAAKSAGRQ